MNKGSGLRSAAFPMSTVLTLDPFSCRATNQKEGLYTAPPVQCQSGEFILSDPYLHTTANSE